MLPKINCLKKKKDFKRVFKEGKSLKENFLILVVAKSDFKKSRFGIVVSHKVSKKATLRNKIKRRIRVLINANLPEIKKRIDAVLIALPGLETKDFWEIEKIINKLFKRAKLI